MSNLWVIDCRVSGSRSRRGIGHLLGGRLVAFGAGRQRLTPLRTVAIDGQGLEPQLPAFEVGVADVGRRRLARHVHVLEIAPERNGWTAAIIRRWARQGIERAPLRGWNAQSKTGRCSSSRSGAPSIVSCASM